MKTINFLSIHSFLGSDYSIGFRNNGYQCKKDLEIVALPQKAAWVIPRMGAEGRPEEWQVPTAKEGETKWNW